MQFKFNETLIDSLCNKAQKSPIRAKLAAVMIRGKKRVGHVCCNTNSVCVRGYRCPSLHAEANAILTYYSKSIAFSKKKGWYFLCSKGNKGKG